MHDYEHLILGESTGLHAFKLRTENQQAALMLAQQAKNNIRIFSHKLDPLIYGTNEFIDAVLKLAIRNRHSHIHILVQNTDPMVKNSHKMIEAARKVSTYIKIRRVHADYVERSEGYLVADDTGYLKTVSIDRYDGELNCNSRKDCKILTTMFEEIWRKSEPDHRMRQLFI